MKLSTNNEFYRAFYQDIGYPILNMHYLNKKNNFFFIYYNSASIYITNTIVIQESSIIWI